MPIIDDILTNSTNFLAAIALVVSGVSILIGFYGLRIQRAHNQLSVRPIANVGIFDGDDLLQLTICNNGSGPMLIKSIETINKHGIIRNYPKDWMPRVTKLKELFWTGLEDTAIIVGVPAPILQYQLVPLVIELGPSQIDQNKLNELKKLRSEQEQERDSIRLILKDLTIRIKYTDIYNNERPEFTKSLDFFGRVK